MRPAQSPNRVTRLLVSLEEAGCHVIHQAGMECEGTGGIRGASEICLKKKNKGGGGGGAWRLVGENKRKIKCVN